MTRILHLSDIHFGREDSDAIEQAADLIHARAPDAIIVSGDLTQKGTDKEFERAAKWLAQFKSSVFCVPGNHDTPMFDLVARVSAPFEGYRKRFGGFDSPFTVGSVCIAGLNSARGWQLRKNWAEGSINLQDLNSAIERLHSSEAEVSVLTCHHPFIGHQSAPLRTRTRHGRKASAILARSQVKIMLSGHVHAPSAEVFRPESGGSYLSITAGTLSTRLRHFPPSCNELVLGAETIRAAAHCFKEDGLRELLLGEWDYRSLRPV